MVRAGVDILQTQIAKRKMYDAMAVAFRELNIASASNQMDLCWPSNNPATFSQGGGPGARPGGSAGGSWGGLMPEVQQRAAASDIALLQGQT